MNDDVKTLLLEYGLDELEIKLYLYMVGKVQLTAYKISKDTKVHKSTCYDVLERLVKKGFVSKIEKDNKSNYAVNEISEIISAVKSKESILESLIPRLKKMESKAESKVVTLEGIEGQKQYDYNLFSSAKEGKIKYCYIIGNTHSISLSSNIFLEKLIKEFSKMKLNKKIDIKSIWAEKYRMQEIIGLYKKVGDCKFLDVPSKVGLVITNEHIAYLYTTDKPYVIEIRNTIIAEEMKVYFELMWNIAKK